MIEEVNKDGIKAGDPKLEEELIKKLDEHLDRMPEYQRTTREQLAKEEAEQKKKITSDDIRDGFDAGVSMITLYSFVRLKRFTARIIKTRTCTASPTPESQG
jgi:hypothetical protein